VLEGFKASPKCLAIADRVAADPRVVNPSSEPRDPAPRLHPENRNPKPETRNPEPDTRNPKPGTNLPLVVKPKPRNPESGEKTS